MNKKIRRRFVEIIRQKTLKKVSYVLYFFKNFNIVKVTIKRWNFFIHLQNYSKFFLFLIVQKKLTIVRLTELTDESNEFFDSLRNVNFIKIVVFIYFFYKFVKSILKFQITLFGTLIKKIEISKNQRLKFLKVYLAKRENDLL